MGKKKENKAQRSWEPVKQGKKGKAEWSGI
jgi:hypothetical protein